MGWLVLVLLVVALTAAVRSETIGNRPRFAWFAVGLAAAMPFTIPPEPQWARLLVAAFGVVFAARAWERSRDRAPDFSEAWWRFWAWWLVPADARPAADADEAAHNRRLGRRRLLRLVPKLAVVVAVVAINRRVDDLTVYPLAFAAWSMLYVYALVSAIADALTGVVMQTGIHLSEAFEAPILARSSSEFWGRRWNRFVTRWAFRNVFIPTGGRRSPVRSTLMVFAVSGLMHEYLIVACGDGFGSRTGRTLAFFVMQGVAVVLLAGRPAKLPLPLARAVHLAFLIVTTPLFFGPLDEAVGYSRWWKGDLFGLG